MLADSGVDTRTRFDSGLIFVLYPLRAGASVSLLDEVYALAVEERRAVGAPE